MALVAIVAIAVIEIYGIKGGRNYRARRNKESFEFLEKHPIFYLLYTLAGLYFIYGVIKKPRFFMKDKRVHYLYEKLGDKRANCLYLTIGIIGTVFGIVSALQIV